MSDNKKDSLKKKINIKNKKEAVKALSKKSDTIKQKKVTPKKKQSNNKSLEKNEKVIKNNQIKEIKETPIINEKKENNKIVSQNKTKKKMTSIIKSADKSKEKKKTIPKKTEKENKQITKEDKKVTEKPVEPKKKKKIDDTSITTKITIKLKDKIFEEVQEEDKSKKTKEESKKGKKKIIIISSIVILLLVITGVLLIKYKGNVKKTLKIYEEYFVGEKITLKDNSIWYVIEDSENDSEFVKLIKETQIDINGDGVFNDSDKKIFSKEGNEEYDSLDKDGVAYYLENTYKEYLNTNVGTIKDISLITSKEFVKARTKMGYGYEWNEGNWLANEGLGTWWINASQNGKVYAVSRTGSYKLYDGNKANYVRPVITIDKELAKKGD